jgi:hypothetical protein
MEKTSEIYDLLLRVKNGYDPGWSTYFSRYDDLLDDINFNKKNPPPSFEDEGLYIFMCPHIGLVNCGV